MEKSQARSVMGLGEVRLGPDCQRTGGQRRSMLYAVEEEESVSGQPGRLRRGSLGGNRVSIGNGCCRLQPPQFIDSAQTGGEKLPVPYEEDFVKPYLFGAPVPRGRFE